MWDKRHGGSVSGAVGNDLHEKTLTHQIVEYALAYMNNNIPDLNNELPERVIKQSP